MRGGRKSVIFPPLRFSCRRSLRVILAGGIAVSLAAAPVACAQRDGNGDPPTPAQTMPDAPLAQMPSFASLVEKVLPAVVNVSASIKPETESGEDEEEGPDSGDGAEGAPSPLDELLRRFFEQLVPRSNLRRVALASGFIIDPAGYIVTNNHVVANADKIAVVFQDNTRQMAKVVGRDALTDLALLKIEVGHPLPYVVWGDSDAARVGDWVLAVGNPFGLGGTVSSGIISARGRDIHAGPYDDFLQIDAAINRGHSGGPTFNLEGRVIGVTTAIYTPSGGSVGIGFAIPSRLAKPIVEQLRLHGKIKRGWLGVQLQEMTPDLARALGLPKPQGVLVADLTEDGPAAKGGLRPGDVILSFDGHTIQKSRDLPLLVAEAPLGQRAAVKVWRRGREITLSPVIEEMPEAASAASQDGGTERQRVPERTTAIMGLTLAPLAPGWRGLFHVPDKVKGVLVLSIAADSPFADVDIARGDVIVAIDGQPVSTPQDAAAKLDAAAKRRDGAILMLLNRGGVGRFVALSIDSTTSGTVRSERPR